MESGTIVYVKGYVYLQPKIVIDVNIKCTDMIIIFGNYVRILYTLYFINSYEESAQHLK